MECLELLMGEVDILNKKNMISLYMSEDDEVCNGIEKVNESQQFVRTFMLQRMQSNNYVLNTVDEWLICA